MREVGMTLPARIATLPLDPDRDLPVPWFVPWIDGKPEFRAVTHSRLELAVRANLCWICGGGLGAHKAFVLGPMCAVNRNSAEPPNHRECAIYAATHCPFLITPRRKRREKDLPEGAGLENTAGVALSRNPGVALVWVTKRYRPHREGPGLLFQIGDPVETLWFAEGRQATRDEVMASMDSGLPSLRELAEAEGMGAVRAFERMHADALRFVPV